MRLDRLIILSGLVVLGCKTTQTTQSIGTVSSYSEDISIHRPKFDQIIAEVAVDTASYKPEGHIRAELDSINQLIIRENLKPRTEQGYTIQVYNGPSREKAMTALGEFRVKFPDIEANMTYFQPDFRVKAGKFLDRVVAYESYEKVKKEFITALLVPEKIKVNRD